MQWIRDIAALCKAAGVPVFVKQLGAVPISGEMKPTGKFRTNPTTGKRQMQMRANILPIVDRKGGDLSEWPEDLRIREFPESVSSAKSVVVSS